MGRRPELKSNEKSKGIPIVLEISGCEHVFTAEKVLYILGASVHAATTCLTPRVRCVRVGNVRP